jgi:hypothetical protein
MPHVASRGEAEGYRLIAADYDSGEFPGLAARTGFHYAHDAVGNPVSPRSWGRAAT